MVDKPWREDNPRRKGEGKGRGEGSKGRGGIKRMRLREIRASEKGERDSDVGREKKQICGSTSPTTVRLN